MEQRHLDISEMKSIFFSLHAFCFFDVNGKRWISSSLKCKPVATSNLFKKKKSKNFYILYICVEYDESTISFSRQVPLRDK